MKRFADLAITAACIPIFIFPVLLVAWQVKRKIGSPIFFIQTRSGLHGRPFQMFKFRTMNTNRGLDGALLADELRLTPFGRWLRSTSLDELPELWNVLKGDMSLVGPRPLLVEYLPLYSEEQARRHEVLPGITGWAQVNGRNSLSWEQRFIQDVWYVDHRSVLLDMRILLLTIFKVLRRDGISAPGETTMPPFRGNPMAAESFNFANALNSAADSTIPASPLSPTRRGAI